MLESECTYDEVTELEALARIDMLTRERDDVIERLVVASLYCWTWDEEDENAVEQFTQRPGYQNGMRKIEEMEARR